MIVSLHKKYYVLRKKKWNYAYRTYIDEENGLTWFFVRIKNKVQYRGSKKKSDSGYLGCVCSQNHETGEFVIESNHFKDNKNDLRNALHRLWWIRKFGSGEDWKPIYGSISQKEKERRKERGKALAEQRWQKEVICPHCEETFIEKSNIEVTKCPTCGELVAVI